MGGYIPAALGMASAITDNKQAKADTAAQVSQINTQNQLMWQQQEQQAKQKRDLLARQLATTRARLAAGGVGSDSASGQALMTGLTRQTETGIADDYDLAALQQEARGTGESSLSGLQQSLSLAKKSYNIFNSLP